MNLTCETTTDVYLDDVEIQRVKDMMLANIQIRSRVNGDVGEFTPFRKTSINEVNGFFSE